MEHRDEYRKLSEDTKKLIFALVGRLDYYEKLKQKGCAADLCKAFDDHYKSGKRQGEKLGRRQGRREGIFAMIRLNMEQGESKEKIAENLKKYFSLSEKDAYSCIQKCRAIF